MLRRQQRPSTPTFLPRFRDGIKNTVAAIGLEQIFHIRACTASVSSHNPFTRPSLFLSLPKSIIIRVGWRVVCLDDLLTLCLLCKRLYKILVPILYEDTVLASNRHLSNTLTTLLSRPPWLSIHIRKLTLRPNNGSLLLLDIFTTNDTPEAKNGSQHMRRVHPHKYTPSELETHYSSLLARIVEQGLLSQLEDFTWDGLEMCDENVWGMMLTRCPRLKCISTSVGTVPLPSDSALYAFSSLRAFSLRVKCRSLERLSGASPPPERLPKKLWAMLIERCPHLEKLVIGGPTPSPRVFNVKHILAGRWPSLKHLELGDVVLSGRRDRPGNSQNLLQVNQYAPRRDDVPPALFDRNRISPNVAHALSGAEYNMMRHLPSTHTIPPLSPHSRCSSYATVRNECTFRSASSAHVDYQCPSSHATLHPFLIFLAAHSSLQTLILWYSSSSSSDTVGASTSAINREQPRTPSCPSSAPSSNPPFPLLMLPDLSTRQSTQRRRPASADLPTPPRFEPSEFPSCPSGFQAHNRPSWSPFSAPHNCSQSSFVRSLTSSQRSTESYTQYVQINGLYMPRALPEFQTMQDNSRPRSPLSSPPPSAFRRYDRALSMGTPYDTNRNPVNLYRHPSGKSTSSAESSDSYHSSSCQSTHEPSITGWKTTSPTYAGFPPSLDNLPKWALPNLHTYGGPLKFLKDLPSNQLQKVQVTGLIHAHAVAVDIATIFRRLNMEGCLASQVGSHQSPTFPLQKLEIWIDLSYELLKQQKGNRMNTRVGSLTNDRRDDPVVLLTMLEVGKLRLSLTHLVIRSFTRPGFCMGEFSLVLSHAPKLEQLVLLKMKYDCKGTCITCSHRLQVKQVAPLNTHQQGVPIRNLAHLMKHLKNQEHMSRAHENLRGDITQILAGNPQLRKIELKHADKSWLEYEGPGSDGRLCASGRYDVFKRRPVEGGVVEPSDQFVACHGVGLREVEDDWIKVQETEGNRLEVGEESWPIYEAVSIQGKDKEELQVASYEWYVDTGRFGASHSSRRRSKSTWIIRC
ncbi:hypothetical protein AMATHDRAFT_54571 [Amanita thiersii Skay4041]|uniref:Uncharacterized protein n=1 Tax=Amanita thiersii Skay4041 TaxID=703135 RepID=A0A2A9NZS2_9AGAR|nr:hypothetical protein AMATHDRAFT_54571 [Amanita thiersii Skay4041]